MSQKVKMFALISLPFFFFVLALPINAQGTRGTARNPIIWADVPDPSVIRVGDTYYMSSTTMHVNPGVPIMKSKDLVNWEIVNYAYEILTDNDAMNLKNGQDAYGKGSWASSLRYHNGTFYVVTFSYTTNKTHIYHTADIENGPWSSYTLPIVCHDPSLLFDQGRVYLVYGIDDIRIIELNSEVTAIRSGGLNRVIVPKASQIAGSNFYVTAEGSHIYQINGKYYLFLISWPAGGMRTELVYRADNLTGPYEGRIALRYNGIAQGGLVDTPDGKWYALLFQDHGSVGRIPYLIPVTWEGGWPILGVNGRVPNELDIPVKNDSIPKIVASDEFNWDKKIPLVWQWNHNPDPRYWSVTERPGWLRIKNGRIASGFLDTQNTLTQRTFGPECLGTILMDVSNMQDGDVAGLGLLQKNYGFVAVKKTDTSKWIIMVNASSGAPKEVQSTPLYQDTIFLKIACDFRNKRDRAYFYYSLDGIQWNPIGNTLQMSYTLPHFMGYRFALFNYAAKTPGGYVDFDYFKIDNSLNRSTGLEEEQSLHLKGYHLYENYPNPFNSITTISYNLKANGKMRLSVDDLMGKEVTVLVEGIQSAGNHEVRFSGANLASGIYFYKLQTAEQVIARKMMLVK